VPGSNHGRAFTWQQALTVDEVGGPVVYLPAGDAQGLPENRSLATVTVQILWCPTREDTGSTYAQKALRSKY
jgi:hypothetical protein